MNAELAPPDKEDPRIQRTKDHVLAITRSLLDEASEPLTFSLVADRAQVARKTLYNHWGTVENLAAETIALVAFDELVVDGLDFRGRMTLSLNKVAEYVSSAGAAIVSVSLLMAAAPYDADARTTLAALEKNMREILSRAGITMSADQYSILVGSLVYRALATGEVPQSLVDASIEVGMSIVADPQEHSAHG